MRGAQNMDGKRGSMCTDTDRFKGTKVGCDQPLACEAMIGPMLHSGYGYCTDLNIGKFGMTGAMRGAKVAQRRTTAGVPCRLPLVYKCVPLSEHEHLWCWRSRIALHSLLWLSASAVKHAAVACETL